MASFQQALLETHKPASAELVARLRESLDYISGSYPHHKSTVVSIMERLEAPDPVLLSDVLVAAYALNGGVMLKQRVEPDEDPDVEALLEEMSKISSDYDHCPREEDPEHRRVH